MDRNMNREKPSWWNGKTLGIIILIIFMLITLFKCIVVVPAGHRNVVFNIFKGVLSKELGEGMHIIIPYINTVHLYDVRLQEYTMTISSREGRVKGDDSVWSPTKEGLQVGIDLTCWFRLDPERVNEVHQNIGPDYEEKIIRPTLRSVVRMIIAQFPKYE